MHVSSRHSCRDATAEHIKGKENNEKELYPEAISKLRRGFYVGHLVRNGVAQHILHFALQHFRSDKKSSDPAVLLLSDSLSSTTGPTVVRLKLHLNAVIAS